MLLLKTTLLAAAAIVQVVAEPQIMSAILASAGLSAPVGLISASTDTKLMKEGLEFASNLTRFATHVVANASDSASNIARYSLNSTAHLGRKAIDGGVKIAQQGLGLAKKVTVHFPGYGSVVNVGASVGSVGLNVANALSQSGINIVANGGDKVLNISNRLVKGGAEKVNDFAQSGISVGKSVVNKIEKAKVNIASTFYRYTGGLFGTATRRRSSGYESESF